MFVRPRQQVTIAQEIFELREDGMSLRERHKLLNPVRWLAGWEGFAEACRPKELVVAFIAADHACGVVAFQKAEPAREVAMRMPWLSFPARAEPVVGQRTPVRDLAGGGIQAEGEHVLLARPAGVEVLVIRFV